MKYSVVSLFSGCGGLDLGFKNAGFDLIWANEIDNDAAATYKKFIHKNITTGDITENIPLIPKGDIIIGGPPCQSFSLVGRRRIDDPRGRLVFTFLEIIIKLRPKVFLMENVPGICASLYNNKRLHEYLIDKFSRIGYEVNILKLNAVDFCVPQKRQRIFLLGSRFINKKFKLMIGEEYSKKILKLKKQSNPIPCSDALGDLPLPTKEKDILIQYNSSQLSEYTKLMREKSNGKVSLHFIPTMSEKDKLFIRYIAPGGNYRDIPDELSTPRIMKFKKTGGRTTTYGRLHPDKPAYTINTYFNRPNVGANYHYSEERLITPREGLRLQSFPDYFTPIYNSQRSLYRQIGNAVPPLLSRALAESIKQMFVL